MGGDDRIAERGEIVLIQFGWQPRHVVKSGEAPVFRRRQHDDAGRTVPLDENRADPHLIQEMFEPPRHVGERRGRAAALNAAR